MATTPHRDDKKPKCGPSLSLISVFRKCSTELAEETEVRLEHMLQDFQQHRKNTEENERVRELEDQCCLETRSLYYKILENLVCQKGPKLDVSHISSFLMNDLYQRSLVTCCLENALKSNRLPSVTLLLFQIYKLTGYHFLQVTEMLRIRLKPGFTQKIRHLYQIQENVLESLAWTSDSSLWEEVRANGNQLPTCQQVMAVKKYEADQSQVSGSLEVDPSTSTKQRSSSAVNQPEKKHFLHRFAHMVYSVMAERLRELSSKLNVSDELRSMVWTCLEYSLVQHPSLMVDRHLDQLLISAIYSVMTLTKNPLTFEDIINSYKFQPHASDSLKKKKDEDDASWEGEALMKTLPVCEEMLVSEPTVENLPTDMKEQGLSVLTPNTQSGEEKSGSFIHFYSLYKIKMQNFVEKFAPTFGEETPPLSPYPVQPKRSSYRLKDFPITVSQLNRKTVLPCAPEMSYEFCKSPREDLQRINEKIKTGSSLKTGRRALPFGTENQEEEEDGPSKRLCLDGDQSALQRRLRNVANDREVHNNPSLHKSAEEH